MKAPDGKIIIYEPKGLSVLVEERELIMCRSCKYKVETDDGEYNPEDIVCSYWDTDGLNETDFCSMGEKG